jgi:UPF0271 protein
MATIDLNSDLGENTPDRQVADDAAMLEIVTSANVAVAFHAGDPVGIRDTLTKARDHGVVVGAHPGYRDYANFGRVAVDIDDATLQADVEYQLGALQALAKSAGTEVKYVKPHGALYNTIAKDARQAKIVAAAVRAVDPNLVFLGLAGGVSVDVAERAGLTSRTKEGAVLHDAELVAARMLRLVTDGTITAADGTEVHLGADSICVHGDSAGAISMAAAVRRVLTTQGIDLAPFAK